MNRSEKTIRTGLIVLVILGFLTTACDSDSQQAQSKGSDFDQGNLAEVHASEASPVEIGLFVDFPQWPLKDWNGVIPEEITKRTGVKLKVTIATDDRELPYLIASDNLPELVFTDKELTRLANNKMSYDWNSLIEQYAPDFRLDKTEITLNTQTNGKFYTLLSGYSNPNELKDNKWALPDGPKLAIREDLMRELGNPPLDTLDDFGNILRMVEIRWPGMIPLVTEDVKTFGYLNAQFGQVGAGNEFYKDENGNLSYYMKQPGKLDFYKYVNKFYREGLIRTDNFIFEDGSGDAWRLAKEGKAFAIIGNSQFADISHMMMVSQPLSNNVKFYNYMAGRAGVFITQKNKHPRESIQFMKFMFSEEGQKLGLWGIRGKDWNMNDKGYPEFTYNTENQDFLKEKGLYWWGKMSGNAVFDGLRNNTANSAASAAREEIKMHTEYDPAMGMLNPPAYSDAKTMQTKLRNMVTNEQLKIYLAKSEQEVVNAYNDMLKKADDIGVQKYEFWANKQYQQALSKLYGE